MHGKVAAQIIPFASERAMMPTITKRVLPATTVYTDESTAYKHLGEKGYHHSRVSHSQAIYVDGDVHTNTIEGFWSLTKNGIRGVYHAVSAKHLLGYLNEYAWRYNHRSDERAQFETLLLRSVGS